MPCTTLTRCDRTRPRQRRIGRGSGRLPTDPVGLGQAAVAYYDVYRNEIDAEIELNEAEYRRGFEAAAAGKQAPRR